jgi:hypothetical protein
MRVQLSLDEEHPSGDGSGDVCGEGPAGRIEWRILSVLSGPDSMLCI